MGVGLGSGVLVSVGRGVFVAVWVAVEVGVRVAVTVGGMMASGVWRRAKKTMIAPMPRKTASNPIAAGRLNVMDGMRLPWTTLADWSVFSIFARSAPQTRHLVASSFTRVPQVGQILVGDVFDSGVIVVGSLGGLSRLGALYQLFLSFGLSANIRWQQRKPG